MKNAVPDINQELVEKVISATKCPSGPRLKNDEICHFLQVVRDHHANELELSAPLSRKLNSSLDTLYLSLFKVEKHLDPDNPLLAELLSALELVAPPKIMRERISELKHGANETKKWVELLQGHRDQLKSAPSKQVQLYLEGGISRRVYQLFRNRPNMSPETEIIRDWLPEIYERVFGKYFGWSATKQHRYVGPAVRFAECTLRELRIWNRKAATPTPFTPDQIGDVWANYDVRKGFHRALRRPYWSSVQT